MPSSATSSTVVHAANADARTNLILCMPRRIAYARSVGISVIGANVVKRAAWVGIFVAIAAAIALTADAVAQRARRHLASAAGDPGRVTASLAPPRTARRAVARSGQTSRRQYDE